MTKEELKQYIDENVYENQDGEITGESLNAVLKAIVDDGGTEVEANPEGEPTETLGKLKIGETIYTAPQGEPGTPSYLHLAYAPIIPQYSYEINYVYQPGDKYIGIRVDNTAGVPSLPENYTWMKFIGDDGTNGAPGTNGTNGTNAYVYIMYAQNQPTQDSDMHASFTSGDKYIGFYAGTSSTAPTSYNSYTWAKFVGDDGTSNPNILVGVTTQQDGTIVFTQINGNTITIDLNHVHPQYYSKAVENSLPVGGMLPDVSYNLGELTGAQTFTFASPVNGNLNHYYFIFTSGSTAVIPTWPNGLTWSGNCVDSQTGLPVIDSNRVYEVSVINGNAFINEW